MRNLNVHTAIAAVDTLGFVAVTVIITIGALRLFIAQMLIHFGFFSLAIIKVSYDFLFYYRRPFKTLFTEKFSHAREKSAC